MMTAFVRTIILYFFIMAGMRLMGKRQIAELEPSELVLTMMISDLASVPMQDFGIPLLSGLLALLVLCGALNVTIPAAAEAGSSDDPLVTLSYLNETFMDSIMERVDQKIAARNAQLGISAGSGASAASNFTVVTLTSGQVLTGDIGCEVMLRVGTAVCVSPSSPGLIDETAATALNNGSALVQNHLYMMTIEGRGVRATAGTTKLLVRGSYTVA